MGGMPSGTVGWGLDPGMVTMKGTRHSYQSQLFIALRSYKKVGARRLRRIRRAACPVVQRSRTVRKAEWLWLKWFKRLKGLVWLRMARHSKAKRSLRD